jgi:hypothetical protein
MAARYDKYDPISGGFRVQLAVAINATSGAGSSSQIGIPLGVGINTAGKLIVGSPSGATGVIGVLVVDQAKVIGDWVDCMTAGEIVDLDEAAFDPGAVYWAASATGVLSTTNTGIKVGYTVADQSLTDLTIRSRLIVRAGRFGTGA